jgi:hypothetical protein
VLAPPKWRGAGAYGSGQEPQPRVSSLAPSAPLHDGPLSHPDDRRVPHTHITAGAPPPVPVELPPPGELEEGVGTAAIGDAIQQLLDAQTAVPQEVDDARNEEPIRESQIEMMRDSEFEAVRDSDPGVVRESQIEMVRDSSIMTESAAEPPVRSLPPAAPITRKAAPVSTAAATRVEPSATPDSHAAPPSARWSVPPTPVALPAVSEPVLSDRELASYSFIEREAPRDASLSPAEVQPRSLPMEDDSRWGLGIALAMLVVGVGGWFLTRGGFPMPPRTPPAAAAPASTTTALPIAPLPGTEPGADPAAQELGDVTPLAAPAAPALAAAPAQVAPAQATPSAAAPSAPAERPAAAPTAPRSLRPTTRAPARGEAPVGAAPVSSPPNEAPAQGVVTLTPRPEAMPETPTRENVQAALDAKRSAIEACAQGQRGVAEVDLTVASGGNVTYAVVGGDFAGTPAGSCIARVVRGATFAPFSKPRFRVIYPFSL